MAKTNNRTGATQTGVTVPQQAVYLTDTDIQLDGDLRVVGDVAVSGAGLERRIGIARIQANQTISSTSYTDVTGSTLTITIPTPNTLELVAGLPLLIEEVGQGADIALTDGSNNIITTDSTPRASVANQVMSFFLRAPLPASTHTPTAGASQTYKLRIKSTAATSDASIFVDFGGPVNIAYLEALRS